MGVTYRVLMVNWDKLYGNIQNKKRNSWGENILMKISGKVYMYIKYTFI
jgi:hypothetical protein